MKRITAVILLLCLLGNISAQNNYAYIRLVEGDIPHTAKEFSFTINGEKITKGDTATHLIKISQVSFDSVVFRGDNGIDHVALAKFRPLQKYVVEMNPCSNYELYPMENAKLGVLRFEQLQTADTLVGMLDSDLDSISLKRGTVYLVPNASPMCEFSRKSIKLESVNYEQIGDAGILSEVGYLFLHGEKLVLRVLPGHKSFDIKIEGYLRKDQTILNYRRK